MIEEMINENIKLKNKRNNYRREPLPNRNRQEYIIQLDILAAHEKRNTKTPTTSLSR
jgi:hypothetical protein